MQYSLPCTCLRNAHTMGRQLFAGETIPEMPLAGGIKCFFESWKILAKDSTISTIVHV